MYCRLARIVTLSYENVAFLSTNNTILSWYHKRKRIHTTRFHDTLYSRAVDAPSFVRVTIPRPVVVTQSDHLSLHPQFHRMSAWVQLEFRRFFFDPRFSTKFLSIFSRTCYHSSNAYTFSQWRELPRIASRLAYIFLYYEMHFTL